MSLDEPSFEQQIVERVGRIELDVQVVTERLRLLADVAIEFIDAIRRRDASLAESAGVGSRKPGAWMKLAEAAEYLSVSTTTVRRLHAARRIKYFPSAEREGLIRVKREDLDRWLMSGEQRRYGKRAARP